ncbi:MAG: ABC transporter permease [Deltaproteobacteria bacterium]|nr:ABC transporter permease [Deltaproteobacteria bacterium]
MRLKERLQRGFAGRKRLRGQALVWPVAATVATLVAWEVLVVALKVKVVLLPPPTTIATVIAQRYDLLFVHLWPTFYQTVLGFLLSVAGGMVVALLLTYSRIFRNGFYPLIVVSQIIPKISVAPLFVVWFGMGDLSRLLLAFLVAFFPMVINTAAGLQSVDEDFLKMARSYMGNRWQIFAKIRLPHAMPYIFSGMKISITLAVIGIIVAEFVASQVGIGYLIIFANGILDTPLMMAAIAVLSVMGLALFGLIALLEKVIVYWGTTSEEALIGGA